MQQLWKTCCLSHAYLPVSPCATVVWNMLVLITSIFTNESMWNSCVKQTIYCSHLFQHVIVQTLSESCCLSHSFLPASQCATVMWIMLFITYIFTSKSMCNSCVKHVYHIHIYKWPVCNSCVEHVVFHIHLYQWVNM